jgi:AAA+ ATPase superfamily predicted ATPase
MNKIIIGRTEEIVSINGAYTSEKSEFLAITGRRRVGKTYLVNAHFEKEMTFHFSGILNAPLQQQLQNFNYHLGKYFGESPTVSTPKNWLDAFITLTKYLNKSRKKGKKVIFIDELPWLDTHKSNFVAALDWFWNTWAVDKNVLLIVCGSATSWMIKKIVNNKGGLHNRLTKRIHLQPFTLKETIDFLAYRKVKLSTYQITQLYMAMGGIPHYLNEIQPTESAMQAIDRICFQKNGLLANEFENLYQALFKNADIHLKIVFALAKTLKGLSRNELIAATNLKDGGAISAVLEELSWCNFIHISNGYGKTKKDSLYRLTDEFSLFYLQFMYKKNNVDWLKLSSTPKWKSWAGYAFENVCFKHLKAIKKSLGIDGVFTQFYSFQSKGSQTKEGTQIDLIIERNDGIIHLCEIKFYESQFVIMKDYAQRLEQKIRVFKSETKTTKVIFPTMITSYGTSPNQYYTGLIQQEITLEDLTKY